MRTHYRRGFLCVVLIINAVAIRAQQKIAPTEAMNHVGKTVSICDVVTSSKYLNNSVSKVTLLNMGGAYPNQAFTIVIDGEARKNFSYNPEAFLLRKLVCVSGKIEVYNGKPQMHVVIPANIALADADTHHESSLAISNSGTGKTNAAVNGVNGVKAETPKTIQDAGSGNVVILTKSVEVRAGPGLSFEVIRKIKAGEAINKIKTRNGWCSIVYSTNKEGAGKGVSGFVSASELDRK